jgi:hypothetical protein
MKPSFEAPGDFGVSVEFLPSLAEIIVSPYVLIYFCRNFSRDWGGFLAKYWAAGPGLSTLILALMMMSSWTAKAWETFGQMTEGPHLALWCTQTRLVQWWAWIEKLGSW